MKNFLLTLWYFSLQLWYNYKSWKWEQRCIKYFGTKPEKITLNAKDFDALVEMLNRPPKYNENLAKLLQRKSPWNEDYE